MWQPPLAGQRARGGRDGVCRPAGTALGHPQGRKAGAHHTGGQHGNHKGSGRAHGTTTLDTCSLCIQGGPTTCISSGHIQLLPYHPRRSPEQQPPKFPCSPETRRFRGPQGGTPSSRLRSLPEPKAQRQPRSHSTVVTVACGYFNLGELKSEGHNCTAVLHCSTAM